MLELNKLYLYSIYASKAERITKGGLMKEAMWKADQVLANAKYERKGDYSIYAYYIDYLKNSDVANDMKAFEQAKKELKEILEVCKNGK